MGTTTGLSATDIIRKKKHFKLNKLLENKNLQIE